MKNNQTDFLHIGEQKGYIEFLNERTTICYIAPDKKYRFTDPEEQVRAKFYVELIEHFQYSQNRIDLLEEYLSLNLERQDYLGFSGGGSR